MKDMINIVNSALKVYFADHITVIESEMGFQKPKKEWVDQSATTYPKMSIYLFDIRENMELRNNTWQPVGDDEIVKRKKPDAYIDLCYMITFYSQKSNSDGIKEEHKWISEALSVLYSNAYIPKEYFSDEDDQILSDIPKIPAVPVHPKFLGDEGGLQLWSALDQYLKPVIYLKVTTPISLAKYLEYAKVLTKILKFGVLDQKNYYTLNIQPPVKSLVCSESQSCFVSKIEIAPTLNYLDAEAKANTNKIILINRENIHKDNFIVLNDGSHSELCVIIDVKIDDNKSTLTLHSSLKYAYPKGGAIQVAKIEESQKLEHINFLEDVQSGITQLKVIGEDIKKLKSGDLISVKNNGTTEYFFITAKFKEKIEIKEILEVDGLTT